MAIANNAYDGTANIEEVDVMAPSRIDGKMEPTHVTLGMTGRKLVVMHDGHEYTRYEYQDQDEDDMSLADQYVRIGGEWVYCDHTNIVSRLYWFDGEWREM